MFSYVNMFTSRLTVVSRAAKQSRTSDTTVCYIHERSILIERSLKACYKKIPYEKQRALQEQLPITSNIRLLLNKYSLFIFSNIPRNVGHFVVFFSFSFSSFTYSLRMWA